ncbi:MAG: hypothetical protein ACRDRX_15765 [Pseudonocardiaceae bacterium]
MSARRTVAALLAMTLGAAVISVLPAAPAADAAPSDSAVTASGKPGSPFSDLEVTVGQTKNLINQVITVSWTGGVQTVPDSGGFRADYLQIMQCWGDDPAGPDRTQCQYGASNQTSPNAGTWVRSRQIEYPFVDPNETLEKPAGAFGNAQVPFRAVGRPALTEATTASTNDFFDSQVTNEIPLARTRGDGAGQEFFEVQTVRQAAGLGCGDPVTVAGVSKGRSCWLVIVPRGTTEVDGSARGGSSERDQQESSPLSQSNWDNRIIVPLEFLPVGQACPIGSRERRVIGHELAVDAVGSWQPALCAGGGASYSYTQLSDDISRSEVLAGGTPGLALITNPIPPEEVPEDRPLVYAPVGLSGLAIAFNVEHQPSPVAPPEELKLGGERFTSMKLTPRLVAKLLTQSYLFALQSPPESLKNNPLGLTVDPEFLKLNPEYKGFANGNKPPDALVQLGGSDLTELLWSWVQADPDANAFLSGAADENGMVVNPANADLTLPTSSFPRNDQSCEERPIGSGVTAKICTLDSHPFTNDMHDAGRSASRGDSQARTIVLGSDNNPTPKKVDRQPPGQRALLAVVDAATADRYGLQTAALRNAGGQFVAPTTANLVAGAAAMKSTAVPGVLASDPRAADPDAYPLTALSYAVTAPSTLDAAAGRDYAAFLRFAAGPGQQPGIAPGQLPLGMAPLPDSLKAQAAAAAATIEAQAGKPAGASPTPQPTTTDLIAGATGGGAGSSGGSSTATDPGGTAASAGGGVNQSPALLAAQRPGGSATKTPSLAQRIADVLRRTPSLPAPVWVGGLLLAVLLCGALAAASSPALHLPVMHRLGAAVLRRVRRG